MTKHTETMNRRTVPGSAGVSPAIFAFVPNGPADAGAPGSFVESIKRCDICETHHHCWRRTGGLTLGIGLRQRGMPVTIYEAGIIRAIASAASSSAGAGRKRSRAGVARFARTRRRGGRGHSGLLFRNPITRHCHCLHRPFAFRVSPWTPCWRKNSANSAGIARRPALACRWSSRFSVSRQAKA